MKKIIEKILVITLALALTFTVRVNAEIKDNVDFTYSLSVGSYIDEADANSSSMAIYSYCNNAGKALTGKITSSDTSIVTIPTASSTFTLANTNKTTPGNFSYTTKNPGIATISTTVENRVYTAKIAVVPGKTNITSITKASYSTVTVKWSQVTGAAGYILQRSLNGGAYSNLTTLTGVTKTSATVSTPWNKKYTYRVVAFIKDGSTVLKGSEAGTTKTYTMGGTGTYIKSLTSSGKSSLKLQWNTVSGAKNYKIYRSTKENAGYKCVKTTASGSTKSYTNKVTKGTTYFYKIVTVYNNGNTYTSGSVAGIRSASSKGTIRTASKISLTHSTGNPYYSNWSTPDRVYYYNSGKKIYAVTESSANKLVVYTLSSTMKYKSKKTIKLSGTIFGGFYHGADGYNYVATGYKNTNESASKNVIKVAKYNSSWKLVKTANIKGKMSGDTLGIYTPFDGGNCRMDMNNGKLYLVAARTMFKKSDGLHHQCNLCVEINTSTMKATYKSDSYVSHSFNQFAKFQNGNLYIVDHGDAYPRAVNLTIVKNYGQSSSTKLSSKVFSIQGSIGGNYTGVTVGGMEVGLSNVMVCGTAQPHYSKVKGVSGFSSKYSKNVYVTVTNKSTGKTSIKWLTNFNVKKTNYSLSSARIVKLSDNRFAVMYSVTKSKKTKTYYKCIDNTGKVLYTSVSTAYRFTGASQPLLYKGTLMWLEATYGTNGKNLTTKTFKMPIVIK